MERKPQDVVDLKSVKPEESDALVTTLESSQGTADAPFVASGTAKCGPKPPA